MQKEKRDYYKILEIRENAGLSEIKKAFREKAKKLHPDTGKGNNDSEPAMRELLTAYQVLRSKNLRRKYNEELRRYRAVKFDYREFLKGRAEDNYSQAKLIFFDLLHEREEEALKLYEEMEGNNGFCLETLLGPEDFMDCAFLLSEAFEKGNDFIIAFKLLYRIAQLETEINYFRHFTEDVLVKVKNIVCKKSNGEVPLEIQRQMVESIIPIDLFAKEKPNFLKKLAEIYLEMGNLDKARYYLNKSLDLKPGLSGTESIVKRLIYS